MLKPAGGAEGDGDHPGVGECEIGGQIVGSPTTQAAHSTEARAEVSGNLEQVAVDRHRPAGAGKLRGQRGVAGFQERLVSAANIDSVSRFG